MSERMDFQGYLVFLDAATCKDVLAELDGLSSCAIRSGSFFVERHVARVQCQIRAPIDSWLPTIDALGAVAQRALAGAVIGTLRYGGKKVDSVILAQTAARDEGRRELLASLHNHPAAASSDGSDGASGARGACRLAIGLAAFLPSTGRDERERSLGRDELLATVTGSNAPGPYYTVYDIAPRELLTSPDRASSKDVVVMARGHQCAVMTGHMSDRLLRRVAELGAREVVVPLPADALGIRAPALLVPDPCPAIRLGFTAAAPFDATHPLEGVTLQGAGSVLDQLRRQPRDAATDLACSLLALSLVDGVVVAALDEAQLRVSPEVNWHL